MFLKNKNLFAIAIALVCNLSLVFGQNQQQQHSTQVSYSANGLHQAVVGDNFWDIAFGVYGTGYAWVKIVELNPVLPSGQSRKAWIDKKTGFWKCDVVIGEIIVVDKSFLSQPQEIFPAQEILPTPKDPSRNDGASAKISGTSFSWVNVLLFIFLCALLYGFYLFTQKQKEDRLRKEKNEEDSLKLAESDPIGSGAPQVKGGVTDEQAIARAINIASGINGVNPRFLNVSNIERGRLFGRGETFYADKPNGLTKSFGGEVGYRGTVSRLDGTEQIVYFLQACGNDVRRGDYTEGEDINFVPDQEQPEVLAQHNNAVEVQQRPAGEGSNSVKLFDWKEKVFDIMEKGVEKDSKFFLNIKIADSELRFDTTDDKRGKSPAKGK